MAHIKCLFYEREVLKPGLSYFKDGIRKGLYLILKDNDKMGVGEVATLDKLHEYKKAISFALSMAKHSLNLKIPKKNTQKVLLSGLINDENIEDAFLRAKYLKSIGINTFKIKVKKENLNKEIEKIQYIYEKLKPEFIRIDANASLDFISAKNFLKSLSNIPLEYIEEPLIDIKKIKALIDETKVNVAIDESFFLLNNMKKVSDLGIKYFILKPGLFSNIEEILNIANEARKLDIKVIFSNCFESPYFSSWSALLVAKLNLTNFIHGIFEQGFFKDDFLSNKLLMNQGKICINDAINFIQNFNPAKEKNNYEY